MSVSRGKKLILTNISSLLLQLTNVVCGFILPRLILQNFGSDVNGLVNSITQFLGVISLLDLGVGAVVRSALYKPFVNNDNVSISKIYVSANRFFKRLGVIFLGYIVLLIVIYPLIIIKRFDYVYTATLIGVMCISLFFQYYFGIVNSLLLTAHQRGYMENMVHIITISLNTVLCAVLIKLGSSIQIVKLITSLIFIVRPLFLHFYVKCHYKIDRKITYDEEPIKQKWNGMAQHFAAFVLEGTDSIVLSVLSSLESVSIYSVYNMVIIGVKNLLLSMASGFSPLIGEMLAKGETEKLNKFFSYIEWLLHTGITLVFGCTGILLVPFISIYTNGIEDANYIQPLFAVLLTIAHAGHCLRLPYNILILAAGHYKQTQCNYIVAMALNIAVSITTVKLFGLAGVATGTLIAMIYQTVWMAWYDSKNIIKWPIKYFVKQCFVDMLTVIIASLVTFRIPLFTVTYKSWVLLAFVVLTIWFVIVIIINMIFYRDNILSIQKEFSRRIGKKRTPF